MNALVSHFKGQELGMNPHAFAEVHRILRKKKCRGEDNLKIALAYECLKETLGSKERVDYLLRLVEQDEWEQTTKSTSKS